MGGNSKKIGGNKPYVETLLVTKFLRALSSPLAQARPTLPPPEAGAGDAGGGVDAAGLLVVVGVGAGWFCLGGWEAVGAEDELGRALQRLGVARFLRAMAW